MTTKSQRSEKTRALFWRSRAQFPVGRTRSERRAQYRRQVIALVALLSATLIVGALFIIANWEGAGTAITVSCNTYPEFCVPLADGAGDPAYAAFEAPESRVLDQPSQGTADVVRGMTEDNVPFIGNPDAPIHFRTVSNFACPHCATYHSTDLEQFVQDYVLEGKATLGFVIVGNEAAAQAALS